MQVGVEEYLNLKRQGAARVEKLPSSESVFLVLKQFDPFTGERKPNALQCVDDVSQLHERVNQLKKELVSLNNLLKDIEEAKNGKRPELEEK